MTFTTILSRNNDIDYSAVAHPAFFRDLNLDQILKAITASRQTVDLMPYFSTPLHNPEDIRYRQEVMRDLEDEQRLAHFKTFAERMGAVNRYLAMVNELVYEHHRNGWFLDAARVYCESVTKLAEYLEKDPPASTGLLSFRAFLTQYVHTSEFLVLARDAQDVKQALSAVEYTLILQSGKVGVKKYEGETDYSIEVEKTFAKLNQGAAEDYLVAIPERAGMNHIEAKILEFVAQLYPEPFADAARFWESHQQFIDPTIHTFDREIQFYLAYLDFLEDIKNKGLPFCYPQVSISDKQLAVQQGFDLALAYSLRYSSKPVVLNDYSLKEAERVIVVTGPNQGGKTTFARTVGQAHYLASLGCPIPGKKAQIYLPDKILTHFEKQEDIRSLRGKLEDDLLRVHEILSQATPQSLLVLNEIFASTTLQDAIALSKNIMAQILELDALCIWVTFIDELSASGGKTVSMVATVDPQDPTVRTFEIIRQAADGLAYAYSLAQKHRLTYEDIKERIR